jgi:hypothetical protein
MKAIILVTSSGSRHLATVVSSDFDTQAWANSRLESFRLLGVVSVVEDYRTP